VGPRSHQPPLMRKWTASCSRESSREDPANTAELGGSVFKAPSVLSYVSVSDSGNRMLIHVEIGGLRMSRVVEAAGVEPIDDVAKSQLTDFF
jgi:hypothetical protein